MRVLKWFAAGLVVALGLVVLLYNVGGYLFEGPWGPIPGGALAGPVTDDLFTWQAALE